MEPKQNNTTRTILIVTVALVACCILLCVAWFALSALLGPEIGTVFSSIIDELATPQP